MKILAIDTSGQTASAALLEDELLIAEFSMHAKQTHSETFLPLLNVLREKTEFPIEEIDAVAVTSGPGSFTGLRIGSATAKGLGFALCKPIVPVPTLQGLAYNLYGTQDVVCPLLDARRNQTYTGLYEFIKNESGEYDIRVIKEQCAVPIEEMITACNALGRSVIFLGDGVPVFREKMTEQLKVPYSFAPVHMNRQRASAVAALAIKYYKQGKIQTAAEHTPDYLRLSQAEREKKEKEAAVKIRKMTYEDAAAAAVLERECFSEPWSEKVYLSTLADENTIYLVAETQDGQLAGICGLLDILGEGDISNVVVAKSFRRQGIAARLFTELLQQGKERGITAFTLEVRASNEAAIGLYEKFGFVTKGRRKNFYRKPAEDALIMWKV